jgi:hypothetical protein
MRVLSITGPLLQLPAGGRRPPRLWIHEAGTEIEHPYWSPGRIQEAGTPAADELQEFPRLAAHVSKKNAGFQAGG